MAEVVGGAKTTAQKSSLKNLSHLWEEVSAVHCMEHTGNKRLDLISGEDLTRLSCHFVSLQSFIFKTLNKSEPWWVVQRSGTRLERILTELPVVVSDFHRI